MVCVLACCLLPVPVCVGACACACACVGVCFLCPRWFWYRAWDLDRYGRNTGSLWKPQVSYMSYL